jgi:hypothetical protein
MKVLGTIFPTPACDTGEAENGTEGEQFALFPPPPPPPPCPAGVVEPPPQEIVPASNIRDRSGGNTKLKNLENKLHSKAGGGLFDIVVVFLDIVQDRCAGNMWS